MTEPLLRVSDLQVWYRVGASWFGAAKYVQAVDGVSLQVFAGESLGLVGETGCGKSTLGRSIVRLAKPRAGRVQVNGEDIFASRTGRQGNQAVQMVFQDSQSSLNPRRTVLFSVTEPLVVNGIASGPAARAKAAEALEWVGLDSSALDKYPHQLSGGQSQRVGFARAVILRPQLIVADEPVSALDMSVQAQVLNLMQELKARFQFGYLFISHDLAVVGHLCDRIAVMYAGQIVELMSKEHLRGAMAHPYTKGLLSCALPAKPGIKLVPIHGEAPDPTAPPPGCRFHPRCPHADDRCRTEVPELRDLSPQHKVACHHAESLLQVPPEKQVS